MPLGDGTGPAGMGPMTGRGAGYCAGYSVPGYMNPYGGRFGSGMGWGRRFGPGYFNPAGTWAVPVGGYNPFPYTKDQEKQALENQVKFLESQIKAVQERIEKLDSEPDEETT